jgi:hypothetical protein
MLRTRRRHRFKLVDDAGTEYVQRGLRHGGGGGGVRSGVVEFRAAPPAAASTVTISWPSPRVPLPLR